MAIIYHINNKFKIKAKPKYFEIYLCSYLPRAPYLLQFKVSKIHYNLDVKFLQRRPPVIFKPYEFVWSAY